VGDLDADGVSDCLGASGVQADAAALHQVGGRLAVNEHAVIVAGDDVAGAGRRAADRVVCTSPCDVDANAIGDSRAAGRVQADVVALHAVARAVGADYHSVIVAGNDVASAGHRAADGVVRALGDTHAVLVSDGRGAGGVQADRLPRTVFPDVPGSSISTPKELPEMTLPAPTAVPPTPLFVAPA